MTNDELLKELKTNKRILNYIKVTGTISIIGAIVSDYEIIKKIYETEYINHIDYLNQIDSRLYIGLITICLSEYVVGKLLYEYLQDENEKIKKLIKY